MQKAGITDYEPFAKAVSGQITDQPISFEVFSDDLNEMEQQARRIAKWGPNIYVKIPVMNTKGVSTSPIIETLAKDAVQLNVTAVFTLEQVESILQHLSPNTPSIISIFAGRIANAGIDPVPLMRNAVEMAKRLSKCEILWASPREAFNIIQAEECGCHIITVTPDLLEAKKNFGKDLKQYSLETVQMFYDDAHSAGYTL
jgi:transaldolase